METIELQETTTLSDRNFENLVQEHGRQVLNTALRVLGDRNLANDVHQEVFLSIWRRWSSFNGDTYWPGYLYRATVRKSLELARRTNQRRPSPPVDRQWDPREPDGGMRAVELGRELATALAKLPAQQADAFVLRRLEGLSTTEVAQILGCSAQTVRVHLYRALKKLSRQLRPYLGG
jgi:RNA polymerase sigma-70 factor, ECF subfamily